MPYSSGTYSLPSGNPVVTGTTISSSTTNTTNSDIATALSTCILKDGTQTITANLPMASHKLTGLSAGTTAGDSVRYDELILKAPLASPTFTGTVTAADLVATGSLNTPNTFGFKNRIINGNMAIDQRNAGASVTPSTLSFVYPIDRFIIYASQASKYTAQQNAGAVTPPVGFSNYLGTTSLSAYSILTSDYFGIRQSIEGFNFADMNWGTANASTVTLSFWVRSSLTGTFGGSLANSSQTRSYPFTYTISSANIWTNISISITGDTTGTWLGATNGTGVQLNFGLGVGATYSGTAGSWSGGNYFSATGATSVVGTSGATFYITGVQLEKGSTATSFDQRAYSQELAMCQRYYQVYGAPALETLTGVTIRSDFFALNLMFIVAMRTTPTVTLYAQGSGTAGKIRQEDGTGAPQDVTANPQVSSVGISYILATTQPSAHYGFSLNASAEL